MNNYVLTQKYNNSQSGIVLVLSYSVDLYIQDKKGFESRLANGIYCFKSIPYPNFQHSMFISKIHFSERHLLFIFNSWSKNLHNVQFFLSQYFPRNPVKKLNFQVLILNGMLQCRKVLLRTTKSKFCILKSCFIYEYCRKGTPIKIGMRFNFRIIVKTYFCIKCNLQRQSFRHSI